MSHPELLEQLKAVPRQELRSATPEFFELVFKTEILTQLTGILDQFFGSAAKPAGQNPTPEVKKLTDSYGGIWKDQTFYFVEREGRTYIAMLWPWGNGISITLKLFPKS